MKRVVFLKIAAKTLPSVVEIAARKASRYMFAVKKYAMLIFIVIGQSKPSAPILIRCSTVKNVMQSLEENRQSNMEMSHYNKCCRMQNPGLPEN